jgi:hypothetical protein
MQTNIYCARTDVANNIFCNKHQVTAVDKIKIQPDSSFNEPESTAKLA